VDKGKEEEIRDENTKEIIPCWISKAFTNNFLIKWEEILFPS
jgi:hypothetical protein